MIFVIIKVLLSHLIRILLKYRLTISNPPTRVFSYSLFLLNINIPSCSHFRKRFFAHPGIHYRAEPVGARPCVALTYGIPEKVSFFKILNIDDPISGLNQRLR